MENEKLKAKARKLGVSVDVYISLRKSNRKIRYMTKDLKAEHIIVTGDTVTIIPAREDSYDRLRELGVEFAADEKSVEEIVIEHELKERLHRALGQLTAEERRLIDAVYFSDDGDGESVRAAAAALGMPHSTLDSRKKGILDKLKNLMEKRK